jgi:hypothetical protein
VKEEAKERMIAAHASPPTFPEQAKNNAARLRALVSILQSWEKIPPGRPGAFPSINFARRPKAFMGVADDGIRGTCL